MAEKKKKTWPIDSMPSHGATGGATVERMEGQYRGRREKTAESWPFGVMRLKKDRTDKMATATRPKADGSRNAVSVKSPKYVAKDQFVDANKRAHKTMSSKMQENEKKRKASDSARANKRRAGGSRFKGR